MYVHRTSLKPLDFDLGPNRVKILRPLALRGGYGEGYWVCTFSKLSTELELSFREQLGFLGTENHLQRIFNPIGAQGGQYDPPPDQKFQIAIFSLLFLLKLINDFVKNKKLQFLTNFGEY